MNRIQSCLFIRAFILFFIRNLLRFFCNIFDYNNFVDEYIKTQSKVRAFAFIFQIY